MRSRRALMVAAAGLLASASSLAAKWTTERWVSLVEMPVAVTRLELAGVPLADLRLFVPALNVGEVQPTFFLETVRVVPALQHYYVVSDDPDLDVTTNAHPANHGGYVQMLLDRGLRGRALADAIHQDLRSRGEWVAPTGARGVDVLRPDFILLPAGVVVGGDGNGRAREGVGSRGASGYGSNGRARSLGDDLRERRRSEGGARPKLEPRGRANGRGESGVSGGGRGRGTETPRGNGRGGGRGQGGGGGRGRGG